MTRDDIIKLADKQGLIDYLDLDGDSVGLLMLVTLCQDVAAAKPLTATAIGNYLRRNANGEFGLYRNGFKDGVRWAERKHKIGDVK